MFKEFFSKFWPKANQNKLKIEHSLEETNLLHWKILITVFFVMTFFVLATSFVIYRDIGRGEFSTITDPHITVSGQVTLERLNKIISYFETKSVTFEQVRKNRAFTIDPSR